MATEPERWRRAEAAFHRLVELPLEQRAAALQGELGDDGELRAEVERMLAADDGRYSLLDDLGDPPTLRPDPWVGRRVGAYRLTARIAVGGMGLVYEAERADGLYEQRVAVKLIRTDTATRDAWRRFDLERRALAALAHPNIARLHDGGTTPEGTPYLVMELIDGAPIDQHCDEHRLGLEARLRLFETVCRTVHFAHQNLVLHRDLKPANVLVDRAGTPKLLDFGIARLLEEDEDKSPTRTLARVLTPEYASPEQLAGESLTTTSDVYSLGVVLYRLLTGRKPFHSSSRSPFQWERAVSERPPTRPSTAVVRPAAPEGGGEPNPEDFARRCGTTPRRLRHRLAGDLDRILLMALRKEPERRYSSAQELAEDIARHLDGKPVAAREDSLLYRAGKFVRRNRLVVVSASLVVAALAFGIVAALRGQRLAKEGLRAAEEEMVHTRIEASSFSSIARFLMDTFLTSEIAASPERREEARDLILVQAARVRRQYTEEVHLRANLLDALGRVCLRLDLFDDAESLVREALELRRGEFGQQSLEVALSLGSLGQLQYWRGDYSAATETLGRALELHRTCPVGTHTDVATAANDLAATLRNAGRPGEAERLHREALALRRAAGADTLPVAESLNNLAGIHLDRAEYPQAEELLSEALGIRRAILGADHPLSLQGQANLSTTIWHLGRRDEARRMLDEAAEGFRALHGEGRDGLARTLTSLARMETEAGEGAAEERLTEALQIQTERLGADHPVVADVLAKLAVLQLRDGRRSESLETWEEALRIRRAGLSAPHAGLAHTLLDYGIALLATGDLERAEEVLAESLDMLLALPLPPLDVRARVRLTLGTCLARTERRDEAEMQLRRGLEELEGAPGVTDDEREYWFGVVRDLGFDGLLGTR